MKPTGIRFILRFLIFSLVLSCSSDAPDENNDERANINIPFNVSVLAIEEDKKTYQTDIDRNGNISIPILLNDELNLSSQITHVDFYENTIVFSQLLSPTKFWKKNLITGDQEMNMPECPPEYNFYRLVTSKTYVGYISARNFNTGVGYEQHFIFATDDNPCNIIFLGHGDFKTAHIENNILVSYSKKAEQGEGKIVILDLERKVLLHEIQVENIQNLMVSDQRIIAFYQDKLFDIFDLLNGEKLSSGVLSNSWNTAMGPEVFSTKSLDNKILLRNAYPQPSPVSYGPILYDLDKNELLTENLGLMYDVRFALIDEFPDTFNAIGGYDIDLKSEIIIVSYLRYEADGTAKYGIAYTNFDAEILKTVELDYQPDIIHVWN